MTWIVTGAAGMLGTDFVQMATDIGQKVVALGHQDLDITDGAAVSQAFKGLNSGDVVINGAAWTQVDSAEENEDQAFRLNAVGAQNLAQVAACAGARMVQISTDYVFYGNGTSPYSEKALLDPLGAYGRTKAAGEWAVQSSGVDYLIVRTAWLYGAHGNCFPKTMQRLLGQRGHVDVVTDQVGQPTWTRDLTDLVIRLIQAHAPTGIYHGTSSGQGSWFEFTQEIAASLGLDPTSTVGQTTSEVFKAKAPRPSYSVLGHQTLNDIAIEPIGDWRQRWVQAAPEILGL